jgi:hypothetical protein
MKCCEYGPKDNIHNTSFSFNVQNNLKLECYIKLGWRSLPGVNTQTYLAHFISHEENEVLWIWAHEQYTQHFIFFAMCYATLGWRSLPGVNTQTYLAHFISHEENEVLWISTQGQYSQHLIFFVTYKMGQIS